MVKRSYSRHSGNTCEEADTATSGQRGGDRIAHGQIVGVMGISMPGSARAAVIGGNAAGSTAGRSCCYNNCPRRPRTRMSAAPAAAVGLPGRGFVRLPRPTSSISRNPAVLQHGGARPFSRGLRWFQRSCHGRYRETEVGPRDRCEHALRRVGRHARHLVDDEPAVLFILKNDVGEGAANIIPSHFMHRSVLSAAGRAGASSLRATARSHARPKVLASPSLSRPA